MFRTYFVKDLGDEQMGNTWNYLDLTARLDWYSGRYVQYGVSTQYRWLDRFLGGSLSWTNQRQSGGGSSTGIQWGHRQQFSSTADLNLSLNYASNTTIIRRATATWKL